jgi:hypothetical protein
LIHFVGDMHQPFHLAGRERGGNEVHVHWGNKKASKCLLSFVEHMSSAEPLEQTCTRFGTHK